MPEMLYILIAVAGFAVGAAATFAFFWTERSRERMRKPQRLKTPQELAAVVLEALPQDHIIVDVDGKVVRASTRAYSYGIVHSGAVVRPEFQKIIDSAWRDGLIHIESIRLRRSMVGDDPSAFIDSPTREWRLDVRVAPMSSERMLILFEDNTKKKRLEETRRDFVANVSHELKTPIGAIALLAETIESSSQDSQAVRHFSQQMLKESRRLANLVQEIIELSRLQEGDVLAKPQIVDIDAVVCDAVDRMRVEAKDRGITLVSGGDKGLKVYGDARLLTTAVRNLLDNAVRYSRPHSRVSVGVSSQKDQVLIAIVDQGEGIPEDMRERVFERFYRGDKARSRETGGSGLGLSIVKHIVGDHGGRVRLWSQEGRGSTFTVVLPEAHPPSLDESSPLAYEFSDKEG